MWPHPTFKQTDFHSWRIHLRRSSKSPGYGLSPSLLSLTLDLGYVRMVCQTRNSKLIECGSLGLSRFSLGFAGIWYLICYYHGDMHAANINNASWNPCVSGMRDFTSAFLFSLETQHTTGYGYFHITEECPLAVFNLCIQSIFGVIMEGVLVGLVFVKMSRAKSRSATLMFSKNSIISQREGELCYMFRVADMRKSHLLDVSVRAHLIKRSATEGEEVTISQEELQVQGKFTFRCHYSINDLCRVCISLGERGRWKG